MKYKCNECGVVFDESEAAVKTISGHGFCSDMDVCPKCHSENLEEDYKEPEQDEPDMAELRGEYWGDVERGN